MVRATHAGCGSSTRIRIPGVLPAGAVRRVLCDGCEVAYSCGPVEEIAPSPGSRLTGAFADTRPPAWLGNAPGAVWRFASLPLAAILVAAILLAVQSGGEDPQTISGPSFREVARGESVAIARPDFTVALPPAWGRTEPPTGAAFAGASLDGSANAFLWIKREPGLNLERFEARALRQMRTLAPNAEVYERIPSQVDDGTVIRLHGTSGQGESKVTHDATLRAVGPLRYYLETELAAGSSYTASTGVDLVHDTFLPTPAQVR